MQSCSFKKMIKRLGALMLALCLAVPAAALAAAPAQNAINTEAALRVAIENAKDGDTLYVDDIEFESQATPVSITKSLTLRSQKDRGSAIFTSGTFVLDGSEKDISVTFENITFYAGIDASMLMDEIWSGDCEPFLSALRFNGTVDAALNDCVFRNYMSLEGASINADYSGSDARLSVKATGCAFLGNAVCSRGGAVLLVGREGSDNVSFTADNCSFAGNLSSNHADAVGGGAIYAENAALNLTSCTMTANEASHQYLLEEPKTNSGEGEEEEEAEPIYVKYADATKGGAIYAKNSSLTMFDCSVAFNSASFGGAFALENTETTFRDGIIAHNHAESALHRKDKEGMQAGTGMGGGLYVCGDQEFEVTILNSSFYGNSAANAYGGICLEGMGREALPFSVNLLLCTYANNSVDTLYDVPVDRSKYFPKDKKSDKEDSSEKDKDSEKDDKDSDKDDKKAEEEKKKAEEEAARKKAEEEARKKANQEAYDKAVAKAVAKAAWDTLPGDIWTVNEIRPQASLIIDETFAAPKRNRLAYQRYEQPSEINYYVYYAAPDTALKEGYLPDVPSAEYIHIRATEAYRETFQLPEGMAKEYFAPYYDEVLGEFWAGDNVGEGSMTYQLRFEGSIWKEIVADDCVSPDLSAFETAKDGYHFIAWQNPDGTPYQSGISYYMPFQHETRQVESIMEPNTYTLHFVSDAGTEDIKQVYGTPVKLPAPSEKKDYDFVSWYKDDASVAKDGEIYLLLRDSTYTAEYTKQFPMKTVIILSAAIGAVLLYLIIARIVDAVRKHKALKDIAEAEESAQREAAEKAAAAEAEANAPAVRLPDPDEDAAVAAKAEAADNFISSAEDGLRVPLDGAAEIYAEEAAAQEAEAALEAAAEAERAARNRPAPRSRKKN